MAESKIEWTGRSDWNPVRGCTRVSRGCGGPGPHGGCYAEVIAGRFSDPGQPFHGFAKRTTAGARWTGKVEVVWDRLLLPLSWRKPAVIFGSSTSDLFHEALPPDEIAQIYAVGIAAHHLRGHTIQWLTKRPERARSLLNDPAWWELVNSIAGALVIERTDPLNRRSDDARATLADYGPTNPPPGIWLGTSVEDQPAADERIPHLLATPAAVRFLSCEPLLEPVDLNKIERDGLAFWSMREGPGYLASIGGNDLVGHWPKVGEEARIDWVIVGGESGPGARPMHPDWARSLRDQCAAAGVPFFFKQWGEWFPYGEIDAAGRQNSVTKGERPGLWHVWPGELRGFAVRLGKAKAGRLLDGAQHDGFPS